MTEQQHPITPPPELLKQWEDDWLNENENADVLLVNAYAAGALAGADTELEACIEELYRLWNKDHIVTLDDVLKHLRAARRPKPPSLKEQALEQLDGIRAVFRMSHGGELVCDSIRRALESIPDPS